MEQDPKRILVLYVTKYGSTKRYAEWIAEKTHADIFEVSKFNRSLLNNYTTVLFGSPVYMGRIKNIHFVKRNWKILRTKKVGIFSVTGVPSDDLRQQKVFRASLSVEIRKKVMYCPLRGAFNYKLLHFIDKMLMSGPRIRFQIAYWMKRSEKTKEMLARFYSPRDWTNKAAIEPIVVFAKHQPQHQDQYHAL
jgi:menaquinone-dependent protoporphyrinogen IX oxidase